MFCIFISFCFSKYSAWRILKLCLYKGTFVLFWNQVLNYQLNFKVSFGLRNRPQEWNDYSIGIVILMFGMGLFLGIPIPIGIPIPLQRGIPIPLKNERNSYSNGNRLDFSKKHNYFLFSFSFFLFFLSS
jgi:hypothetical protein